MSARRKKAARRRAPRKTTSERPEAWEIELEREREIAGVTPDDDAWVDDDDLDELEVLDDDDDDDDDGDADREDAHHGGWHLRRYPRHRPRRQAEGGIRARSKRGAFGQTWWARRWLEVLARFDVHGRLRRGRTYARQGQVLDIAAHAGVVTARVQGSLRRPYDVKLRFVQVPARALPALAKALRASAATTAKLLAGELPEEIEPAFTAVGVPLFPTKQGDLQADCSCPDWGNPCKHAAAVCYLLAEEMDRDPWLWLTVRGVGREALLASLGLSATAAATAKGPPPRPSRAEHERERAGGKAAASRARRAKAATAANEPRRTEPLPADPHRFWTGPPPTDPAASTDDRAAGNLEPAAAQTMDDAATERRAATCAAAVLDRLGPFPFWRAAEPLADTLRPLYAAASARALELRAQLD